MQWNVLVSYYDPSSPPSLLLSRKRPKLLPVLKKPLSFVPFSLMPWKTIGHIIGMPSGMDMTTKYESKAHGSIQEHQVSILYYKNWITNNIYSDSFQKHRPEYVLCFLQYLVFTISKKKNIGLFINNRYIQNERISLGDVFNI